MADQIIRLGLVGYGKCESSAQSTYSHGGRGADLFRLAIEGIAGLIPAAVCDIDPTSLDHARQDFPGIRAFLDYREMLDSGVVDAIIIGTPVLLHSSVAIHALGRDIHVLSEVPAVGSIEDAKPLWDAHLKSRAMYMLGANPNFRGDIDAAVDLQHQGLLGEVVYAEVEYVHDMRAYWASTPWRKEVPPIIYCTHSLGPVLRLIPEELQWVSCMSTGSHITGDSGVHDFMAALFRTASNVLVRYMTSFVNYATPSQQRNYRMFTTKGSYEITRPFHTTLGNNPAEAPRALFYSKDLPTMKRLIELPVGRMPPAYANSPHANQQNKGHGGIDYAMLNAFIKAIRQGSPSPINLRDALCMSLPGLYANESAKKNGEVTRILYPWSSD